MAETDIDLLMQTDLPAKPAVVNRSSDFVIPTGQERDIILFLCRVETRIKEPWFFIGSVRRLKSKLKSRLNGCYFKFQPTRFFRGSYTQYTPCIH